MRFDQIGWAKIRDISPGETSQWRALRLLTGNFLFFSTSAAFKSYYFDTSGSSLFANYSGSYLGAFASEASSNYYYRTSAGIFAGAPGNVTTIATNTVQHAISGFDVVKSHIAYSVNDSGTSYILFGNFSDNGTRNFATANFNTGFSGSVSLSRNGLYCCLFGTTSAQRTIKVYTPQGGYPSSSVNSANQVGANITFAANLLKVKINNSGTRLVALTLNQIATYDLVSGTWSNVANIDFVSGGLASSIALSADGKVLIHRQPFLVESYRWLNNAWKKIEAIQISPPNGFSTYSGNEVDISDNTEFLIFDIWDSGNSKRIEIYKSAPVRSVYVGSQAKSAVYYGAQKLWPL